VYKTKNSYLLFGYHLGRKRHSIGQQYLITSHLYFFDKTPDERFSILERAIFTMPFQEKNGFIQKKKITLAFGQGRNYFTSVWHRI
jgi:hypothetical protein